MAERTKPRKINKRLRATRPMQLITPTSPGYKIIMSTPMAIRASPTTMPINLLSVFRQDKDLYFGRIRAGFGNEGDEVARGGTGTWGSGIEVAATSDEALLFVEALWDEEDTLGVVDEDLGCSLVVPVGVCIKSEIFVWVSNTGFGLAIRSSVVSFTLGWVVGAGWLDCKGWLTGLDWLACKGWFILGAWTGCGVGAVRVERSIWGGTSVKVESVSGIGGSFRSVVPHLKHTSSESVFGKLQFEQRFI